MADLTVVTVAVVVTYLRANHNYWTLLDLRYDRHVFAGNGVMVQNAARMVLMVKIVISMYLLEQLPMMPKQVNIFVM